MIYDEGFNLKLPLGAYPQTLLSFHRKFLFIDRLSRSAVSAGRLSLLFFRRPEAGCEMRLYIIVVFGVPDTDAAADCHAVLNEALPDGGAIMAAR